MASTMVPCRVIRPRSARWALIVVKVEAVSAFSSSRRRNLSRVVASGAGGHAVLDLAIQVDGAIELGVGL